MNNTTEKYILDNWSKCIRYEPNDVDTLVGLPRPYIVPTMNSGYGFQEMYYWDTYFTCRGLILSNRVEDAKNNAEDMAFLIEKYGYMPNGTRTYFLDRSQPPFFCMLVDDVYHCTKDTEWLKKMYFFIKKEYNFWKNNRMTPIGLNRYGASVCGEEYGKTWEKAVSKRIKREINMSEYDSYADLGLNILAEAESGWDFNPRWFLHALDFAPADLNSNLYIYEVTMERFAEILRNGESKLWNERAAKRRELMNQYLWNGEYFDDYNYVTGEYSKVFSAAAFYPLWSGVATQKQAESTKKHLNRIEFAYGISPCEKNEIEGNYQWGFPNLWAPLQFVLIGALKNYGYQSDAARVANKYITTVEKTFETTGKLWEKYNVETGGIDVINEYAMPEMLGWTAGTYLYAKHILATMDK